jgi:hypothetical protein
MFPTEYFCLLYNTGELCVSSDFNVIIIPLFFAVKLVSSYLKLYEHLESHFPVMFCGDILMDILLINITI